MNTEDRMSRISAWCESTLIKIRRGSVLQCRRDGVVHFNQTVVMCIDYRSVSHLQLRSNVKPAPAILADE